MSENDHVRESTAEESRESTYQIREGETVIEAILNAVSSVTNVQVSPATTDSVAVDGGQTDVPPLHNVIDPEALASLSPIGSDEDADWQVTFPYAGCRVTVTNSDTIVVSERSPPDEFGG